MTPEQQANQRAYRLLVAIVTIVLGVVGLAVTLLLGLGAWGLGAGLALAVLVIAFAPGLGERLALRRLHATPAAPERYPRYHNLVEGLCVQAGVPVPRLWVIESGAANAFSVGRGPREAAIVVTTGLITKLNRIELEGVLAHELAHVQSSSARLGAMAVVLGGLPGLAWEARRRGGNPLLTVVAVLLMPLAPLLRLAAPPRREEQADQDGAYLTRYPPGLARALTKLGADPDAAAASNLGLNHLWIVAPGQPADPGAGSRLVRIFETHPSIEARIEKLREL